MSDLFPKLHPVLKWGLIIGGIGLLLLIFWGLFG